jgi:signal transduction histidine kinase
MSDTPSPVRDRAVSFGAVEIAWGAFALINLGGMWALPGSETIPFHFIYLSMAVVYGFRVWPLKHTLILLGVITVSTGTVLVARYFQGVLSIDECAEIVLMPLIFAGQVWHAERHLAARREVERMATHEREMLQRQREFLRDVSHAVRTPLTIARGHLDLIRAEAVPETVIEDADVIGHQLERLANMASRLLALEQLEGPEALALTPFDVGDLVEMLASRWQVSVPTRQWRIDSPSTGTFTLDVERLELALDALLENAVKFTDDGDTIGVTCHAGADHVDAQCIIAISDTGTGVETEDLPHLFDRFWKRSRPGARPGHGLGLSVVLAIAEAHGGTVSALPRPGGGSVFTIALPRVLTQAPPVAVPVP